MGNCSPLVKVMPIYEYRCECGKEFEELRLMSQYSEPSTCPKCGADANRIMSSTQYRMAEPFRVVDSGGNVTQERQVISNTPRGREPKPEPDSGISLPVLARDGNVYYPRGGWR